MSKDADAIPLKHLIQAQGKTLRPVFMRARQLAEITRVLQSALPANLAAHCRGVNIVRNTLVLFADSATWATRLRYEQKAILTAISRELGLSFARISLRVHPASPERQVKPDRWSPRTVSRESRQAIESAARGIADPELAAALQRLAESTGKENP